MKNFVYALFLLLNSCMNLPPAIKDAPVVDIGYSQAKQNIASYKNAPVRWGGKIIDVENEQNFSLVQVLYYPLSYYGRPDDSEPNDGRFVIKSPEFLDPAIYTKNKEITVAGTLAGEIDRTVGKKIVRVPLIASKVTHLWPEVDRSNYYGYGGGGGGFGGYGYPYYGPYYWGGYYRPYRW
jgi:outer membrane lipoprotein